MWNQSESDKKYYEARARETERHNKALEKARIRGEASVEWHKHNILTAETLEDFKKFIKNAEKCTK